MFKVPQGDIQLFLQKEKKKGSCYFGNQAVLNVKESYVCFCLCVYKIHVSHIEQGLLHKISKKCKCFYCCDILRE